MLPSMLSGVLVAAALTGAGAGPANQSESPRCRKYSVEHPVYPVDHPVWGLVRTSEKAEDWVDLSNEELRSRIDDVSYRSAENAKMVGVLKVLAQKYGETGEDRYAYKAAVILHRYSEVLKHWGWHDRISGELRPHDYEEPAWGWMMPPRYAGMWSSWHPYDLHHSAPIVLAYDQIYNSGQIEKLGQELGIEDMKLHLEKELLYYNLSIDDRYPLSYGNTEANRWIGMLTWGQALGDPELAHRAIRFGDGLVKISYFPSGFWHEGSPSYHMMITGRWATYGIMPELDSYSDPPGYVDPVDGTRFESADFRARWRPFLEKAARQMQKWVLPNGNYAAVHDTHWTDNTAERWDCYGVLKDYRPSASRPILHTWVGHAVLGRGEGERQVQAHLHFSGTYGHEHQDNLNFFLWARNKELLSETDYRSHGHRGWGASTAGHNTVAVDEQSQFHRSSAPQRQFTEMDEVDVEDFDWARKTVKHGTCLTDGMLRLFATDCPGVQVVEADGHRSYPSELAQLYRRTLVMVESADEDVYLVDIFRVHGGTTRDWMLHGPLQDEYAVSTSLQLVRREGRLHGHLEQLRSAITDEAWQVEFVADGGQTVRTTMMPAEGTEVILGEGPAMRREGTQTFLDVRREEPESVFVAVHEPYVGQPRVRSVELVTPQQASETAVVVRVDLPERSDYVLCTLGEDGTIQAGDLNFRGRFAFLSVADGRHRTIYMTDASLLKTDQSKLEGRAAYVGTVTQTLSVARGDAVNAFVTDAELPTNGLEGKLLLTTDGDGSTRGFWVEAIRRERTRTLIEVDRIPGMTVEDGYVKQQYFPNWGISGELEYRIVNSYRVPQR